MKITNTVSPSLPPSLPTHTPPPPPSPPPPQKITKRKLVGSNL